MKRKLLRSFAVLAMALMCGNAWADYDGTSAVYCPTNQTNYDNLATAYTGIKDLSDTDITLELHKNVNLTARFTWDQAKNLKIVPKANVEINRPGDYNGFLNKSTGSLTIGSSEYTITIKGNNVTNYQRTLFYLEGNTSMTLENIVIKDIEFGSGSNGTGYIYKIESGKGNSQSKLYLKNVVVNNCTTKNAGLILNERTDNDLIYLYNKITFENCSGAYISTKGRIRVGEGDNKPEITNPISIYWAGTAPTSNSAIIAKGKSYLDKFTILNDNLSLYNNHSTDITFIQAYTATTSSEAKGAATLVLPFESTIPDGVKAYKLNSVNSDNTISTEEVKSKLSANTPVLINTTSEGGKYKFVSTNTTNNEAFATSSGSPSEGLLRGVYSETYVPVNSYILAKGKTDGAIGFYKVNSENTKKVNANHAYMTLPESGSLAKACG